MKREQMTKINSIKYFLTSLLFLPASSMAVQDINLYTARNTDGVYNVRTVMPGILIRGGSSNKTSNKTPLSNSQLCALRADGITKAFYFYTTGFSGNKTVSCNSGEIRYEVASMNNPKHVFQEIRKSIDASTRNDSQGTFVHCWFGVHASGYVAAAALVQFCDWTSSQAVEYWKGNVPKSIQYPKVINQLRAFKKYSDIAELSEEQKNNFCPKQYFK